MPAVGVVRSPAGVCGSRANHVRRFEVGADGASLTGGDVVISAAAGSFDNIRLDRDGRIWARAGEDGVHCYAADGTLIGRIRVHELAANVTFGGLPPARLFIPPDKALHPPGMAVPGAPPQGGEAAGPAIGCNFDPSHMFWQGIDPCAAVRVLGEAVFHVHAKDTRMYEINYKVNGVLDTKPYSDEKNRSWIFRTVGYGHDADFWGDLVSTLQMIGYDDVLSIEHEDSLMSVEEGLTKAATFLNQIVIKEKLKGMWWA